jgi:ATP-dependent helicase/nuclease subunit A
MQSQLDQILSDKSYMVMAGAGAGKTTRLVKHIVENFISFKLKKGRWPRIVGTTFTKKAASEIQDRVSVLYKSYNDPEIFDFAYSSYLNIGTVHSLCLQLLRQKSNVLGFSQDLKISTSESFTFIKKKILSEIINSDYMELLSDYGFNSISNILNFIEKHKETKFIPISVESQNKILREIIDSVHQVFFDNFKKISIQDLDGIKNGQLAYNYLHGLGDSISKSKIELSFFPLFNYFSENSFTKPRFKLKGVEEQNTWSLLWDFRNQIKDDILENYYKLYDKLTFEKLAINANKIYDIQILYNKKLLEYKKQESIIEMSDIEPMTLELLRNHRQKCADFIQQWDFYYIDEYQDTNGIQKEIFDILLENTNFFKVGDPQQSIYLFRGAKSSIYEEEFKAAENNENIGLDFLDINYRSDKNLLLGINELFDHIDAKNFRAMVPHQTDTEILSSDNKIKFYINLNEVQEINFVVDLVKEKISNGIHPSDICILSRTKALLYKYETEFQKFEIPSVLLVSGNFENRQEVREILHFISFLEDPLNDEHLHVLLRSKSFLLNSNELVKVFRLYKESKFWCLWDVLNTKPYDSSSIVLELNEYLKIYRTYGLIEAVKKYLLESEVLRFAKSKSDLNRRQSNVYKLFVEILEDSVDSLDLSESFRSILSRDYKSQAAESIFSSSNQGVKLLTIHGSKGLEFDEVFVVGAHKKGSLSYTESLEIDLAGQFVAPYTDLIKNIKISGPLQTQTKNLRITAERQETLRQIYVAATRARKNLYFFGQNKPWDNSIYKNIRLDKNPNFKFIDMIDPNNIAEEKKTFSPRSWDFDEYANTLSRFDKVYILSDKTIDIHSQSSIDSVSTGLQEVVPSRQLNRDNQTVLLTSKLLKNISVTELVHIINQKELKFNYKTVFESKFTEFKYNGMNLKSYDKILLGQIFHKYLEMFAKNLSFEELNIKFKNTYLGDMTQLAELVQSILKIKQPNISEVFNNCNVEWGFNSSINNKLLISGQIDLWGIDSSGVIHIIDYKSGQSRYQKKAAIQIAIYKQVLKQLYPNQNIKTHLLYMSEGKMLTIETDLDIESIV